MEVRVMDISVRATPDGEEDEDEAIDPRIEIELNKLNSASLDINILEKQLDEARAIFRQRLTDAARNLKALGKGLGQAVDKARPYFEAMNQAKKAQQECHQAAVTFERACQLHKSAREAIGAAEEKLMKNPSMFDNAWQEVLNNADLKLMEAEREKHHNARLHEEAAITYQQLAERAAQLERQLKKSVNKARPYFEQKAQFLGHLEEQKARVQGLERRYNQAKHQYASSLKALESISEEIHLKRHAVKHAPPVNALPTLAAPSTEREDCVGAESSTPPPAVTRPSSTQRSDSKVKDAVAMSKRSFRSGRFRSSLQFDLDVDFDIDGLDALSPADPPKSPSSVSVDIGMVNRNVHTEYEVLDVAPFLDMERRLRLDVPTEKIEEVNESSESLNRTGVVPAPKQGDVSGNVEPENGFKRVFRTWSDSSVLKKMLPLQMPLRNSAQHAVNVDENQARDSVRDCSPTTPITMLDVRSTSPMLVIETLTRVDAGFSTPLGIPCEGDITDLKRSSEATLLNVAENKPGPSSVKQRALQEDDKHSDSSERESGNGSPAGVSAGIPAAIEVGPSHSSDRSSPSALSMPRSHSAPAVMSDSELFSGARLDHYAA